MTAFRDFLPDEVDRLSSSQYALCVELSKPSRQLRSVRTKTGTVSGQMTEQKKLKKDVVQKATDARYKLHGAKARITQLEGRVIRMRAGSDRILMRAGRLRADIQGCLDQLIENLQSDLHNYLNATLVALKASMTIHRG